MDTKIQLQYKEAIVEKKRQLAKRQANEDRVKEQVTFLFYFAIVIFLPSPGTSWRATPQTEGERNGAAAQAKRDGTQGTAVGNASRGNSGKC